MISSNLLKVSNLKNEFSQFHDEKLKIKMIHRSSEELKTNDPIYSEQIFFDAHLDKNENTNVMNKLKSYLKYVYSNLTEKDEILINMFSLRQEEVDYLFNCLSPNLISTEAALCILDLIYYTLKKALVDGISMETYSRIRKIKNEIFILCDFSSVNVVELQTELFAISKEARKCIKKNDTGNEWIKNLKKQSGYKG